MRKTRRVRRKPYGTLRKSKRYRRGGGRKAYRLSPLVYGVGLVPGGKRRGSKRRRSSRKKRGGNTSHFMASTGLRPSVVSGQGMNTA